jgi:hypothetical protein
VRALHEQHYFFCIDDTLHPTVTKYSICKSWLTLRSLGVIGSDIKKIYVFHDGGRNEYNNSSGLLLYSTLQRMWYDIKNVIVLFFFFFLFDVFIVIIFLILISFRSIEFVVNSFVSYHGKGPWDGLIGSGMHFFISIIHYLFIEIQELL